jgi:hypothetical protein
MVVILLYGDDVVLLSRSCVSLQKLLNKLIYEFCTSFSIVVNLSKTKNHENHEEAPSIAKSGFFDQLNITWDAIQFLSYLPCLEGCET